MFHLLDLLVDLDLFLIFQLILIDSLLDQLFDLELLIFFQYLNKNNDDRFSVRSNEIMIIDFFC